MLIVRSVVFAMFLFMSFESAAQSTEKDEVEGAVQQLFDGMRASDGEMMQNVFYNQAVLHTVRGEELIESDISRFVESVAASEKGSLDEQLTSLTIHVDGNLATAWMDYEFHYAGEFSHCGVNTMNLLKTAAGWKIFSIVDTRRTEGC